MVASDCLSNCRVPGRQCANAASLRTRSHRASWSYATGPQPQPVVSPPIVSAMDNRCRSRVQRTIPGSVALAYSACGERPVRRTVAPRRCRQPVPAGVRVRVEPVMSRQGGVPFRRREQLECHTRTVSHRDSDHAVQRDHWTRRQPLEQVVEAENLPASPSRLRAGPRRGPRQSPPAIGTPQPASRREPTESVPRPRRWPHGPIAFDPVTANGTIEPSAPMRAARRASVSSMSASSPAASPSPGSRSRSCRARRMASMVRSRR